MSSSDARGRDHELARSVAMTYVHELESQPWGFDIFSQVLDDSLGVIADTRGRITFVLATGGPHVELELGGAMPQISVFWGSAEVRVHLDVQTDQVDELVGQLWMTTMLDAINSDQ